MGEEDGEVEPHSGICLAVEIQGLGGASFSDSDIVKGGTKPASAFYVWVRGNEITYGSMKALSFSGRLISTWAT